MRRFVCGEPLLAEPVRFDLQGVWSNPDYDAASATERSGLAFDHRKKAYMTA